MKKVKTLLLAILLLAMIATLVACDAGQQGEAGKDGHTPTISIGDNGNWIIDGVDTGFSAQGPQGEAGKDGHTPTISIGNNGNWIIDGVDIGIKAQGSIDGVEQPDVEHVHEFNSAWEILSEPTCLSIGQMINYCSTCGESETTFYGDYSEHTYSDIKYDSASDDIYHLCTVCNKEESLKFSEYFTSDENGHVEVVGFDSDAIYVKPVADEGYYFLNWEKTYDDETSDVAYSIVKFTPFDDYNYADAYKAIFTSDSSLIHPVTVDITVENDLDVDIEYLPYVNKAEQYFSFYVNENDNLVLSRYGLLIKYTGEDSEIGDTGIHFGGHYIDLVNSEDVELLPRHAAGTSSLIDEHNILDTIYIEFADVRDKCVLTLKDKSTNNEVRTVWDKNQKVVVNTREFWSKAFQSWSDEDGNIISYDEEFEFVITENTTIYINTIHYDVFTQYKGHYFYFMINDDGTLSLCDFSSEQYDTVEIPSAVDGRMVTGLGILRRDLFAGKLIIPDTIVDIAPGAFKYYDHPILRPELIFGQDRTDLEMSDFYGCPQNVLLNLSEKNLRGMVVNQLHTLALDIVGINVVFESNMEDGTFGFYAEGTQTITIQKLSEDECYNSNAIYVLAHELRHYYQSIAIGSVTGIDIEDLIVIPTENEIGAWKYLEYTQPGEDYNKYYYNAREIDAREYAEEVMGFAVGE